MIAIDTSSLIDFFSGNGKKKSSSVRQALSHKHGVLPPVVLTEMLSDPTISKEFLDVLSEIPVLDVQPGYWVRAGLLRSRMIEAGHRARLADVLITQSCLDAEVPLISNDKDFKIFAQLSALELVP